MCCGITNAQFSIPKGLLEVFTGAWCQYCADGYVKMNAVDSSYEDAFTITVHNGDAMTFTECDDLMAYYSPSFPQALLNRSGALLSRNTWMSSTGTSLSGAASVTVSFDSVSYDPITRGLDVYLKALFTGLESGDLRFNCIVVEDSVTGAGTGYNQVNADNTTPGHPYYGAGNPIVGFQHRNVARAYLGGTWGISGVIPSTVNFGTNSTHHFTYTLPAGFDEIQISLIGIVSEYNGTGLADRKILNVERYASITNSPVAVNKVEDIGAEFNVFPNPNKGDFSIVSEVACQLKIISLSGQILNNLNLSAGVNNVNESLPTGLYLLEFITDKGSAFKKMVIE